MTQRTIIVLAAILALLVLVILASQRGEQATELGLLVPELQEGLDEVTAVTVTRAGGEVVATMNKTEAGWTVEERDGFPADFAKLRSALVALAEARRIERKTANQELYDRLGVGSVDNSEATGTLVGITGLGEPVAIIIGDAAGTV